MLVYQFMLTGELYLMDHNEDRLYFIVSEYLEWFTRFNIELFLQNSVCLGDL
jgi:hypothetical protein